MEIVFRGSKGNIVGSLFFVADDISIEIREGTLRDIPPISIDTNPKDLTEIGHHALIPEVIDIMDATGVDLGSLIGAAVKYKSTGKLDMNLLGTILPAVSKFASANPKGLVDLVKKGLSLHKKFKKERNPILDLFNSKKDTKKDEPQENQAEIAINNDAPEFEGYDFSKDHRYMAHQSTETLENAPQTIDITRWDKDGLAWLPNESGFFVAYAFKDKKVIGTADASHSFNTKLSDRHFADADEILVVDFRDKDNQKIMKRSALTKVG